ncbi:hypothetical protein AB3N59_12730 [Leptospira sp. WS92.C1]
MIFEKSIFFRDFIANGLKVRLQALFQRIAFVGAMEPKRRMSRDQFATNLSVSEEKDTFDSEKSEKRAGFLLLIPLFFEFFLKNKDLSPFFLEYFVILFYIITVIL